MESYVMQFFVLLVIDVMQIFVLLVIDWLLDFPLKPDFEAPKCVINNQTRYCDLDVCRFTVPTSTVPVPEGMHLLAG